MRPAVAGKQVRTPMPLQPSTVVDDDSCEIGEYEGRATRRRDTCIVWIAVLNANAVDVLAVVP